MTHFKSLGLAAVSVLAVTSGAAAQGLGMLPEPLGPADFRDGGAPDLAKVELGRALMFDKELSGNRNISCATCHHPFAATSDGLSLPIGEGAMGISVTRDTGTGRDVVVERVPRNAPALFNLGAFKFTVMFHDGRVAEDAGEPGGFLSPAGADLPPGLESALAAQATFPVTSPTEMAGQGPENPISKAAQAGDLPTIWALLADRLRAIPGYVDLFGAAYGIGAADITYVHAANAIAAFESATWQSDDSPFDQYLHGDSDAMSKAARRGMELFYGAAGCAGCHAGPFQTDHDFHAIAMPQIGPRKGDGLLEREDFGRERVTGDPADRFRFRTPSLRNVALTAPYGHSGAYAHLEDVVRHHFDPVAALENYDRSQAVLPSRTDLDDLDFLVMSDPALVQAIADANELAPWEASDAELAEILEFLNALTDSDALDLRDDVPRSVPSGLPVFD